MIELCYRTAALAGGVDPLPMTLRELDWMADTYQRAEWQRTAEILALTYNINRRPDAAELRADDLNPYAARGRTATRPKAHITTLKSWLPERHRHGGK